MVPCAPELFHVPRAPRRIRHRLRRPTVSRRARARAGRYHAHARVAISPSAGINQTTRRFGGLVGDVLGAASETATTVILLVCALD